MPQPPPRDSAGLQNAVNVRGLHLRVYIGGTKKRYQVEIGRWIQSETCPLPTLGILRHATRISQNMYGAANRLRQRGGERMADEEQVNRSSDFSSKLAWFLTGAAIGAAVALLYAPRTGKDARRAISRTATRGKEAVAETASDIVDSGRDMFERGRRLVDDAADLFDRGRKLVQG